MARAEKRLGEARVLRQDFPLSMRAVLYRASRWTCWSTICSTAIIYLRLHLPELVEAPFGFSLLETVSRLALQTAVISVGLKLGYETLYILFHDYRIECSNLVVRRGVICRTTASLPLQKITDVCIQRGALQLIFGLWDITIQTASGGRENGRIEGLSTTSAFALHESLLQIIGEMRAAQ